MSNFLTRWLDRWSQRRAVNAFMREQALQAMKARAETTRHEPDDPSKPKRLSIADGLEALPPEPDKYRRSLQMPTLPRGVRVSRPQLAMDDVGGGQQYPNGAFLSANGYAFGLYFPGYQYLAEIAQRSEFRQPTETHAKDMTRKWILFKSKGEGDKTEKIKKIQDEFERLSVQDVMRKALTHDGFYGLGHIYIDVEGNDDPRDPLLDEPETIPKGSLVGFRNIEPMWTTPVVWNAIDPRKPDFYRPASWMVLGGETHHSRLMQVISREVPDILKPAYNFGGISLSQLIEPYVDRWLKTVSSVNRLINNFSIIFLQTDMASILEGGTNAELLKRLRMFIRDRDNQGIFVTDKEREMLNQLTVSLSGLSELQAQAQEHMAAPTHLPLVVLTGITPSGLNASSEGEIEVYHEWNLSEQIAVCATPLKRMLRLVQLSLFGKVDEDITFGFVPLKELTGEAAARVRKLASEAGIAYIDAGVIDAQEERERIANDPDSGYTNLDAHKKIDPPEEPDDGNDPSGSGEGDQDETAETAEDALPEELARVARNEAHVIARAMGLSR